MSSHLPVTGYSRLEPLTQGLASQDVEIILAKAQVLHVPSGTRIFEAGETNAHILVIQSGRVRTFITTNSGEQMTTGLWSSGCVLGLLGAATTGSKVLSAESIDAVVLLKVTATEMQQLVLQFPQLGWNLIRLLSSMASSGLHRAVRLATAPVAERLIDALVALAQLPDAQGAACPVIRGVSQETIASMVGASRPWVAQALNDLSRRGLLVQERMRISIPSLTRLKAAALP